LLLASASLALGCSNPCDDLAVVCAYCPDRTYQQECVAIVDKQNHGVCSADLAIFRAQCPVPPSASSSSGSTSSLAAGSGGSTATGPGGGN